MPYGSKVPTEGIIRLSQLQDEFGGGAPTALSEYYKAISGTTYEDQFVGGTSTYWTVPAGVTQVTFYGYGGGGCGGGNSPAGGSATGQGGGGGAYVQKTFSTTPGESLLVVVGAGGGPWVSGSAKGPDGGDTYIKQGGSTVCTAGGGQGGNRLGGGLGAGGIASGGDINNSGGEGQAGDEFSYTGWGANAAGPSGNGASGAQRQAGTLPEAGSGSGGNINHPRNGANGNPPPGVPGGGGGGGNGGASGAAGIAKIRYTASTTPGNKYVTNLAENAAIPSSGQVSLSTYYGSARATQPPVVNEYTVPGTYTYEAPLNTTSLTVTAIGGGGNGSYWGNNSVDTNAGGGGGGGFIGTITASAGDLWTLVVAQGGPSGSSNSGGGDPGYASSGQATTLTSGTRSITAGGGGGGRAYGGQTIGGSAGVVSYSGAFTDVTQQNGATGGTAGKGSESQGGLAGLDGYGPAINLYRGTNNFSLVGPAYAGRGVSSREYYQNIGQVGRNGYIKILAHGSINYNNQGTYTWTVPTGITSVTVTMSGAGGGGGNGDGDGRGYPGGSGARLTGTLTVSPGNLLTFYIGGKGYFVGYPNGRGPGSGTGSGSPGGAGNASLYFGGNGGAPGPSGSSGTGGGGGAATALKVGATTIAVAGGGGGGGAGGSRSNGGDGQPPTGIGGNTGSTNGAPGINFPNADGYEDGPGSGGGGGGYEGGAAGAIREREYGSYSGNPGTNLVPLGWVVGNANNGGDVSSNGQDGGITISW